MWPLSHKRQWEAVVGSLSLTYCLSRITINLSQKADGSNEIPAHLWRSDGVLYLKAGTHARTRTHTHTHARTRTFCCYGPFLAFHSCGAGSSMQPQHAGWPGLDATQTQSRIAAGCEGSSSCCHAKKGCPRSSPHPAWPGIPNAAWKEPGSGSAGFL